LSFQVQTVPDFQIDQDPQAVIVIAPAREVLSDQPIDAISRAPSPAIASYQSAPAPQPLGRTPG
jgi:hypothetical protein